MKNILISLALVAIASTCWAGNKTTYLYNKDGERVGFIRETDVNKQIYSRHNGKDTYQGRISKNSSRSETLWGRNNEYLGHSTCVGESCNTEDKVEED